MVDTGIFVFKFRGQYFGLPFCHFTHSETEERSDLVMVETLTNR